MSEDLLCWLDQIQPTHRHRVGDKAFYLGQLQQRGYPVVPGVVVQASALQEFLQQITWLEPLFTDLPNSSLHIDVDNYQQLQSVTKQIRQAILTGPLPDRWLDEVEAAIQPWQASLLLLRPSFVVQPNLDPTLSHRTTGLLQAQLCRTDRDSLAQGLRQLWAELFRARSLFYWQRLTHEPQDVLLAVLVQPLQAAIVSGEAHSHPVHIDIRASWGLGHAIVQGEVLPDFYRVHRQSSAVLEQKPGQKPIAYFPADFEPVPFAVEQWALLTAPAGLQSYALLPPQQQQLVLTKQQLEQVIHFTQQVTTALGTTVRLEWLWSHSVEGPARFYLTQVAPQLSATSIHSAEIHSVELQNPVSILKSEPAELASLPPFSPVTANLSSNLSPQPSIDRSSEQPTVLRGLAASPGKIMTTAWVVEQMGEMPLDIPTDVVLVAPLITPDWLIGLGQVAGIVTEQGGVTSHAAILAREMQIPAVVGVDRATRSIQTGDWLLVDGMRGEVQWLGQNTSFSPETQTPAHLAPKDGSANPASLSHQGSRASVTLPGLSGVSGLSADTSDETAVPRVTRLFVTLNQLESIDRAAALPVDGVGLLRSEFMLLEALEHQHPQSWLAQERQQELVHRIADRIRAFAAAFNPRPVFYRSLDMQLQDFPRLGAEAGTGHAALGVRGTLSYCLDPTLFQLELAALRQVQQSYTNVNLLLPYVRTVEEFTFCQTQVAQAGLRQNSHFQLWIMAEVPSVLLLLPEFIQAGIQGIAIGSNDLTQLVLGVDRNQTQTAAAFNQIHPAVQRAMQQIIAGAKQAGIPCSICGQAPVQHPDLVQQLVQWGITAISVAPSDVAALHPAILRAERRLLLEAARQRLS